MVMGPDEAARRYEDGVNRVGGAGAFYACGDKKTGGFLQVSACLHDLKKAKGTTAEWASRYRAAA